MSKKLIGQSRETFSGSCLKYMLGSGRLGLMIKKPVGLGLCLYRAGSGGTRNSDPCIVMCCTILRTTLPIK